MNRHESRPTPHDLTSLTQGSESAMPPDAYITFTEQLLGAPIFPEGVTLLPDYLIPGTDEVRRDVRLWGVATTLRLAAHALDGEPLALTNPLVAEKALAATQTAFAPELGLIARQIRGGNKFALSGGYENLRPPDADEPDTARAQRQIDALDLMSLFMQTVPQSTEKDAEQSIAEQCRQAMTIISSTGSGKTGMEAFFFKTLGIGEPISANDSRIARGLLVFTNQALGRQFLGERGNDTFRRFSGITDLNAYWQHGKRTGAALDLVSKDSLPEALARKHINPEDYEAVAVDEGHHALAQRMTTALRQVGNRLLLFTATPAREIIRRDLRHQLSTAYAEIGSLRADVEAGLLSPVQLLTVLFEGDPAPLAAKHALTYAEQGRRVFVYCQPLKDGDKERQSVQVAELINQMAGRRIAASIGSHNSKQTNEPDQDEFFDPNGELRVLTTCRSLGEGVDGPVNDTIFIGPFHKLLPLAQGMGRCMRPGEGLATITELMPRARARGVMVSTWQAFGLDRIPERGFIFAPPEDRLGGRGSKDYTPPHLHPDVETALALDRPLRSITLAARVNGETVTLENHVSSKELARDHNLPITWLHYTFDANELPYVGVRRADHPDNFDAYERWYEREPLETYIANNPLPELADKASMTAPQIATSLQVTYDCVKKAVKTLDTAGKLSQAITLGHTRNARGRHHDGPAIDLITKEVYKTPRAGKSDVQLAALNEELDGWYALYYIDKHAEIKPVPKRYRLQNDVSGVAAHITTTEAATIRAAFAEAKTVPVATPGKDYGYDEIAVLAETTRDTVKANLTAEETILLTPKRLTEKSIKTKPYLPHKIAMQVVERLKSQKMPPHLVPFPVIAKRSAIGRTGVENFLAGRPAEIINLGGNIGRVRAYTWQDMQRVEQKYGIKSTAEPVNYDKFADTPETVDYDRLMYSVLFHARHLPAARVMRFPRLPIVAGTVEAVPKSNLLPSVDGDTLTELKATLVRLTRPPAPAEARVQPPRQQSPSALPAKSPVIIPETYRNLVDYLAERGVNCQPSLLPTVIRRAGIYTSAKKDAQGLYWDEPQNAELLRTAIMQYPVAAKNLVPAPTIAEQYKQHGITLAHITHAASTVRSSLEGLVSINRVPETNMLAVCYQPGLAKQVTNYIDKLVQTGRLSTLLRMGR